MKFSRRISLAVLAVLVALVATALAAPLRVEYNQFIKHVEEAGTHLHHKVMRAHHEDVTHGKKGWIRRHVLEHIEAVGDVEKRERRQTTKPDEWKLGGDIFNNDEGAEEVKDTDKAPKPDLNEYVFHDDTSAMVKLEWVGKESKVLMVLSVDATFMNKSMKSKLYRSTDYGKNFEDITASLVKEGDPPLVDFIKHPLDPDYLIFFDAKDGVWVSEDGGESYDQVHAKIVINEVRFHETKPEYIMAAEGVDKSKQSLHLSQDGGRKYGGAIFDHVTAFGWGTNKTDPSAELAAYAIAPNESETMGTLWKTSHLWDEKHSVMDGAYHMTIWDTFIFLHHDPRTVDDARHLYVSENGGVTFNRAQFPANLDEFGYMIVDASEGSVFVLVLHEKERDVAWGNLYLSDASGIWYDLALDHELDSSTRGQPPDLVRVDSVPGFYMATQVDDSGRMRTVATYDKGGEWHPLVPPQNDAEKKPYDCGEGCSLNLHGDYSAQDLHIPNILAPEEALGLVLAHGNVAEGLTEETDVFLSRDGGLNWNEILKGPHVYTMADSGAILLAVKHNNTATVEAIYSLNEGAEWVPFKFTTNAHGISLVGVYTEPGGTTQVISLWGFDSQSKEWVIVQADFKGLKLKACEDADYETWTPSDDNEHIDCVLGQKFKWQRRKQDVICYNGKEFKRGTAHDQCKCEKEDFECNFGFMETDKGCEPWPDFNATAQQECKEDATKWTTSPYRQVPGDKCKDGVLTEITKKEQFPCPDVKHPTSTTTPTKSQSSTSTSTNTGTSDSGGSGGSHHSVLGSVFLGLFLVIVSVVAVAVALYVLRNNPRLRGLPGFNSLAGMATSVGERFRGYNYQPLSTNAEDYEGGFDDLSDDELLDDGELPDALSFSNPSRGGADGNMTALDPTGVLGSGSTANGFNTGRFGMRDNGSSNGTKNTKGGDVPPLGFDSDGSDDDLIQ
eukprot:Clim_evm2s109 gene=Clim_evmTU2s109